MHETQLCKVLVEPFSTGRNVTNGCEEVCSLVHSGRLKSVNCDVNLPKGLDSDLHLIFLVTPATSIEPAVISDASLDNAQVFLTSLPRTGHGTSLTMRNFSRGTERVA